MARKKRYHYIYKTTCKVNGKYYIGMHSTYNLNDGYLGSGTILLRSVKKYGEENFSIEILDFFDDRDKLKDAECEIVNEQLLEDPMCMNLQVGGGGGFKNEAHQLKCSSAGGKTTSDRLKNDPVLYAKFKKVSSDNMKTAHKEGKFRHDGFLDKKHTEESKIKIGLANSVKQKGELNSQFGTLWIYNTVLKESKKIKEQDLETMIQQGWQRGRKIKF